MQKNDTRKGSIMAFVLVILTVASILFVGLMTYIVSQVKYASRVVNDEEAFRAADAGIDFYRWYLAHQTEGMQMQEVIDFWQNTSPAPYGVGTPYVSEFNENGNFSITVTPPSSGSTNVIVESVGWTDENPEFRKTIKARLRLSAWSDYVILSDSDIYVPDGEDVDGKVHSNGGVRFDGVAHNVVSSSVTSYIDPISETTKDGVWTSWSGEYNSNMGSMVFLLGRRFPVPEKDFDSVVASFSEIFAAAQELNFDFNESTKGHQIVLEGSKISVYEVLNINKGVVTKTHPVSLNVDLPDIAAIYVNKNIWIEGTLGSGKKLVVASDNSSVSHGNIYISNDITYENYSSGIVLGLVAKNNIEIVEGSENDLRIDAALLAQGGSVGRADYGDSKSLLTIYGAIATKQGYGFSGYQSRNIIYDNALVYSSPPFFPIEGIYKIDNWNEL